MPKYGLQIEIRLVPDLGWHWRVFTDKKIDWSGTADSMDHAFFKARNKAKELLNEYTTE